MRRLQHPRLIQLYDAIETGKQIYVILELIQGGELFERVIDDDFVLTERSCAVFMRQICEGIEFVHAQHILHLDMKPENILCLTKEGNRIKIIDFGLAREYDPKKKLQVLFGTPEFVAPEVVNFDQIGFGTDMWSIGVICYVLLSGLSPFMGDTDIETMANVTIAKYDFDDEAFSGISEDAKDFIKSLLIKDLSKRSTASQCRQHRWLAQKKMQSPSELINGLKVEEIKTNGHPVPKTTKQELDVTKDNLRLFVERWREHPDSPYTIETDITPVGSPEVTEGLPLMQNNNNNMESMSLRCHSPSPCGSLSSSMSDSTASTRDNGSGSLLSVPNLGLAFERRASEGANVEKARDAAAQIILAEEIIKLSEHLRSIAMGQRESESSSDDKSKASSEDKTKATSVKKPQASLINKSDASSLPLTKTKEKKKTVVKNEGKKPQTQKPIRSKEDMIKTKEEKKPKEDIKPRLVKTTSEETESNEISEKLSNITRQRKLNGTTFNGNRFEKYADTSSSSNVFTLKKTSKYNTVVFNESFSTKITDNFSVNSSRRSESEANSSLCDDLEKEMDLSPPWRKSRSKRRFSESCRDVPRITNLQDMHKTLNLDEPKSTKDLLLHLLTEWDDTRPSAIGRKSSVDWCGEESVARMSMNSLAEYFQSEQKKSATTTPKVTPSIHR
ncbi:calcium/calmodulin-dependent protein kinase type II delta 2 chain-like isoform X2 [Belonocnema kinseyi]|uniref:calcium/calmodulin-dependent protein kinase type II delta 2 chain-like isoform X2 n=2 Tax=Belonocnema kinseyi TaxID=2817044 RepID=UPI00143DEA22|nr:calcium/calmodulin-dependent protein kinase type II delta 2 chain-like isoform X2 [Belonocnema kinseyi]XP_033217401.1 calcium/calmodulin-dependent protein kinase type II delta 2 chain-like isoform X2 [Belonocnema kinseyi]